LLGGCSSGYGSRRHDEAEDLRFRNARQDEDLRKAQEAARLLRAQVSAAAAEKEELEAQVLDLKAEARNRRQEMDQLAAEKATNEEKSRAAEKKSEELRKVNERAGSLLGFLAKEIAALRVEWRDLESSARRPRQEPEDLDLVEKKALLSGRIEMLHFELLRHRTLLGPAFKPARDDFWAARSAPAGDRSEEAGAPSPQQTVEPAAATATEVRPLPSPAPWPSPQAEPGGAREAGPRPAAVTATAGAADRAPGEEGFWSGLRGLVAREWREFTAGGTLKSLLLLAAGAASVIGLWGLGKALPPAWRSWRSRRQSGSQATGTESGEGEEEEEEEEEEDKEEKEKPENEESEEQEEKEEKEGRGEEVDETAVIAEGAAQTAAEKEEARGFEDELERVLGTPLESGASREAALLAPEVPPKPAVVESADAIATQPTGIIPAVSRALRSPVESTASPPRGARTAPAAARTAERAEAEPAEEPAVTGLIEPVPGSRPGAAAGDHDSVHPRAAHPRPHGRARDPAADLTGWIVDPAAATARGDDPAGTQIIPGGPGRRSEEDSPFATQLIPETKSRERDPDRGATPPAPLIAAPEPEEWASAQAYTQVLRDDPEAPWSATQEITAPPRDETLGPSPPGGEEPEYRSTHVIPMASREPPQETDLTPPAAGDHTRTQIISDVGDLEPPPTQVIRDPGELKGPGWVQEGVPRGGASGTRPPARGKGPKAPPARKPLTSDEELLAELEEIIGHKMDER
jgi:hypothetical protein